MSRDNVEAARRLYDARNRGDIESVVAELHPQVEWRPHLSSLGGQPVQGHAEVRRYLRSLAEDWAEFRHEPEQLFDAGDRVVAFLRTHAVGRRSGVALDIPIAHLLTFEGGRCRRSVSYVDRSRALECAGSAAL